MDMTYILQLAPVIPVVTIEKVEHAVPLARALLAGGIRVIEITLRTPAALEAIERIQEALSPTMVVGAGTVLEPCQIADVRRAGAQFAVSPGLTAALAEAARESGLPYLPAAITPAEILLARSMGLRVLKFFPARPLDGVEMLKEYAPVFPDTYFCPTGGITPDNMRDYLSLKNVLSVGGMWLTAAHLVEQQAWGVITELARQTHG